MKILRQLVPIFLVLIENATTVVASLFYHGKNSLVVIETNFLVSTNHELKRQWLTARNPSSPRTNNSYATHDEPNLCTKENRDNSITNEFTPTHT